MEINEANTILGNPHKRYQYDHGGNPEDILRGRCKITSPRGNNIVQSFVGMFK